MARETDKPPAEPYTSDYENQRQPAHTGEPPRPATEPPGSEGSSDTNKTLTDPATGEPHMERKAGQD